MLVQASLSCGYPEISILAIMVSIATFVVFVKTFYVMFLRPKPKELEVEGKEVPHAMILAMAVLLGVIMINNSNIQEGRKSSFLQLLKDCNMISIPKIQRDYAQGRSDEHSKIVRLNLLRDIKASYEFDGQSLDLGFVYGVKLVFGKFGFNFINKYGFLDRHNQEVKITYREHSFGLTYYF